MIILWTGDRCGVPRRVVEESPNTSGQRWWVTPTGSLVVEPGKVPQRTDRRWVAAATTGKGETVR